jgi:hypothetical protein
VRGTDAEDLCQTAIDEDDGIEIFTHGSSPEYLHDVIQSAVSRSAAGLSAGPEAVPDGTKAG